MSLLWIFLFFSPLKARAAPSAYPVSCADKAQCPDFIAGLSIWSDKTKESHVCSGFLIESSVLVTNFHCIPEEIQKPGASCHGLIHVYFPETPSRPREDVDCDRILSLSNPLQENHLGTDYAILHLDRGMDRPTLDVNAEGFSDAENMTIFKVDPTPQGGSVKKIECPAVQNTILNPYFNNNESPVVDLIPCRIIKGNSGSPILDAAGKVKGVLSAKSELPLPERFQDKVDGRQIDVALGSSFACIDTPSGEKNSLKASCQIKLDTLSQAKLANAMYEKARKKLESGLDKSVPEILRRLEKATHHVLSWTFKNPEPTEAQKKKGVQYVFQFAPTCVNLIKEKIRASAGHLKKDPVRYEVPLPSLEVEASYDDRYRIVSNLNRNTKTVSVEMLPYELLEGSDFKVYIDKGEALSLPSCYVKVERVKPRL